MISRHKWSIPASIEPEYDIPEGSDAVKECARCLEYCRKILAWSEAGRTHAGSKELTEQPYGSA